MIGRKQEVLFIRQKAYVVVICMGLGFPIMPIFYVPLRPPVSHHSVCSVATAHNLTPVKRDD